MLDMGEENLGQLGRQVVNTKQSLWHGRVNGVCAEIELLLFNGLFDWNAINDILLRSIFDSNKSEPQRDIFTFDHSFGICTLVHNVDLGDHTNSPDTFRIALPRHLKTV